MAPPNRGEVAGGGPVSLVAALVLAREGIPVVACEREAEPGCELRASMISAVRRADANPWKYSPIFPDVVRYGDFWFAPITACASISTSHSESSRPATTTALVTGRTAPKTSP